MSEPCRSSPATSSSVVAMLLAIATAGCGRIGYDAIAQSADGGSRDGGSTDGARLDGAAEDASIPCVAPRFGAPLVDDFDRADGPLALPWVGQIAAFGVEANQLALLGGEARVFWSSEEFGPDQVAYITVVDAASYFALVLKKDGPASDPDTPHFSFEWDPASPPVHVHVYYFDGVEVMQLARVDTEIADGDVLAGVARADGRLELYRNGELLTEADGSRFMVPTRGGFVGLISSATGGRLDDFGAGQIPVECR